MEDLLLALNEDDTIYTEIIKTNLSERKLLINTEISDALIERIVLMILKWNKEDKNLPVEKRKKIILYLNSIGGDVCSGNAIIDAITTSKTPVITVALGQCASMCSYILMAGSERICFPHSIVLLHDGSSGYCTTSNKGRDIQKYYDSLDSKISEFVKTHTNMTDEYLESIKDRELYLWGTEAKEKGIIDKIVGVDVDIDYVI